jgi:hypothetical protein
MVLQDKMDFTDGFFTGIYHTSFVRNNGIIFPLNITNGEDLAFLAKAVSLAPSVETVGDVIYNYCRRSNSADTEIYNSKQLHSVFKAYENAVLFINEHDISETVISKIYARYIESSCYLWNRVKDEDKKMSLVDAAAFAIRLYKLCPNKNALNEQLINQNMTSWIGFLEIGNIEYFADYLSQHSTRKQKIFTDLRLRVLRANPKHAFRPTQWLFFGYCFWEIMFLHI